MFLRQRASKGASLSDLFGCADHGLALAVDDVAGDESWFADEAKNAGSTITHVIDTHIHADLPGGRRLAQHRGAKYCLHIDATIGAVTRDMPPRPAARHRIVAANTGALR